MAAYKIKEVLTRRDLMRFIKFPDRLYKGCEQYVPALHRGQAKTLMHSAALAHCERKMWIVEDGKNVVGRICGIINRRYNEKYSSSRVRFGWFDTVNDLEVAGLLIDTAAAWAKEKGMTEIHGPLQYNTFGRQGMLVEGFDKVAPFSCLYNYPYYVELMEKLGFEKECDWLQYRMAADQQVPQRMQDIAARLMERYNLRVADFDSMKSDPENFRKFFKAYNASFDGPVHNFIPFTDAEIQEEIGEIADQLDKRLCCVLLDSDDEVAAFGISTPWLSEAMKKAKGSLFPFGWYHALKAKKNCDTVDLMITGAAPKWQNTGISAVFHCVMAEQFRESGVKWAVANPQIETNSAVFVWEKYDNKELWLRRRCWIRKID